MSSSDISSRSISGSTSSSRSGGEVLRAHRRQVGARALDPHRARPRARRGRSSTPLADVLPPPKFDTARLAPSRCDARTSWPERVLGHALRGPEVLDVVDDRGHGAHRVSSCLGLTFGGHPRGVAGLAEGADRVLGGAQRDARLGARGPDVGVEGVEQDLVAAEHVAGLLGGAQRVAVDEQRLGVGLLQVDDATASSPRPWPRCCATGRS